MLRATFFRLLLLGRPGLGVQAWVGHMACGIRVTGRARLTKQTRTLLQAWANREDTAQLKMCSNPLSSLMWLWWLVRIVQSMSGCYNPQHFPHAPSALARRLSRQPYTSVHDPHERGSLRNQHITSYSHQQDNGHLWANPEQPSGLRLLRTTPSPAAQLSYRFFKERGLCGPKHIGAFGGRTYCHDSRIRGVTYLIQKLIY